MSESPDKHVTRILHSIADGDESASERLLPLVYGELRKLAASRMAALRPGQTLQPTALVHEAYMRLVGDDVRWDGRGHFFGAAAQAMRNILVDQARRKSRHKHGGDRKREPLHDVAGEGDDDDDLESVDHVALDEALRRLEEHDRRMSDIVTLRYFAGLSIDEVALALDTSPSTIDRQWRYARAWLRREMER